MLSLTEGDTAEATALQTKKLEMATWRRGPGIL